MPPDPAEPPPGAPPEDDPEPEVPPLGAPPEGDPAPDLPPLAPAPSVAPSPPQAKAMPAASAHETSLAHVHDAISQWYTFCLPNAMGLAVGGLSVLLLHGAARWLPSIRPPA